jgi:hypothetical protein
MNLRKLRTVFSVTGGVIILLLIVVAIMLALAVFRG